MTGNTFPLVKYQTYRPEGYIRPPGDQGTGYFCKNYTRTIYTVSDTGQAKYTRGRGSSVSYLSRIREPEPLESQSDPNALVAAGVKRQKQTLALMRRY